MTEEIIDPIQDLIRRIASQLDEFEIHMTSYQDKVRRALTEIQDM